VQTVQIVTRRCLNVLRLLVHVPIAEISRPGQHTVLVSFLAETRMLQIVYVVLFDGRLETAHRALVLGVEIVLDVVGNFEPVRFSLDREFSAKGW
jgi:hypothetical protein